ncbi:flippase-like domain-containing protein [bacterium]|nr:flippase-like domain-containing protein [bacterium]
MNTAHWKKFSVMALRYLLLAGILFFAIHYTVKNYDRFASHARFTALNISLLLGLNVLTLVVESVRFRLMIRKVGYDLGAVRSFFMFGLSQAINHIVPKAGTFSTGYYLSRKYGVRLHSYITFILTYIVFFILASGILGIITYLIFYLLGYTHDKMIPVFFALLIIFCAVFIGAANITLNLKRFPRIIALFLHSLREIFSDHRLVATLVTVEIVYYLLCSLRFMIALSMFSGSVNLLESVVILTVGNFFRIVTFMPGGLGIAEIASAWTAGMLGKEVGLSGLSAGLDRLVYFILIMIVGSIGFLSLSGRSEFHKPPEMDDKNSLLSVMNEEE